MNRSTKSIISMLLCVAALFCLVSCKGTGSEQTAANNTPVPVTETEIPAKDTAVPTVEPTASTTEEPTPEPTETPEPTPDPNERPDPVTVEWLAAELMRRYNAGRYLTLELADYSDIMERNADTDLFYYDNQLEIDMCRLYGGYRNVLEVSRGEIGQIDVVSESESVITVHVWTTTIVIDDDPISGDSVGTNFSITVDKQRMMIIAYDRPYECEGYYRNDLKPLAMRYRNQGLSWQDADKKAYDELYVRLESEGY